MAKFSERSITSASALDVEANFANYFGQLFNSASKLLEFKGFPEEVDIDYAVENLLLTGRIMFFKKGEKFYFLDGFLGGEENVCYRPTKIQIANPHLGSFGLTQNVDGVCLFLTPFDKLVTKIPYFEGGITSLIKTTAMLLADNITSINVAQINTRVAAICSTEGNNNTVAVEDVLRDIYAGKPYKIIKSGLIDSFKVNPLSTASTSKNIIELVELHQYILAQFWNALGIQYNSNMKRERLVTAEVEANIGALKIPIQTILDSLKSGTDKINEIWGLNCSIGLNPKFKPESEPKEKEDVQKENQTEPESVGGDLSDSDGSTFE